MDIQATIQLLHTFIPIILDHTGEASVMCKTVERVAVRGDIEACKWSSCSEWCLSKGGGDCTHLYVREERV